jgi:spore coat protein CotH
MAAADGRMGPPGGFGGESEEAKPGVTLSPDAVKPASTPFYDKGTLRTLFFDFDDADWLKEMGDFYGTDVEVPATLTVDGKRYSNVGVSYRGASSYFTVGETQKRSLNVSVDHADAKQKLMGYKSLNLLNAHEDPTFLHSVLFLDIAGRYMPAPKANLVRVVINGENWGIYSNCQQFNREMLAEHFSNTEGARWKVPGSPQARGGLEYIGDDIEKYKQRFEIKSKDSDASWKALIRLCKTLNETPTDQLEAALAPMLDIESTLWFLAIDCALVNNDGYWTRSSDYNLYLDTKGVFHIIPHDANETFGLGGGPGGPGGGRGPRPGGAGGGPEGEQRGRGPNAELAAHAAQDAPPPDAPPQRERGGGGRRGGGPGGMRMGGPTLDPLVGLDDAAKPLRSKLLAVPSLQRRYLEHVRTIATDCLDWEKSFGPMVMQYHELIRKEIELDTKKLASYEAFLRQIERSPAPKDGEQRRGGTLRDFVEERRAFLLNHPKIKALADG